MSRNFPQDLIYVISRDAGWQFKLDYVDIFLTGAQYSELYCCLPPHLTSLHTICLWLSVCNYDLSSAAKLNCGPGGAREVSYTAGHWRG